MEIHDINKKKLLRRSVEARHDLTNIIVLSVMLAFMLWLGVWSVVTATEMLHESEAHLAEVQVRPLPEDSVMPRSFYVGAAEDGVRRAKESQEKAIGILLLIILVYVSGLGYYGWRLWQTLHRPDDYEIYEGRLTDPSGAPGRGRVYFKAVFTGKGGQTVIRDTRGIYSKYSLDRYRHKTVLIAYDRENDRMAVYDRDDEY